MIMNIEVEIAIEKFASLFGIKSMKSGGPAPKTIVSLSLVLLALFLYGLALSLSRR
jgi:hypothetical protein